MFQKLISNRIKFLILILLFLIFTTKVKAIVKPTSDFYVNDYANILSEETKTYIMNKSVALHSIDGTQIVVTTVNNLEGMSIEDYSLRYARAAGIGDKEKNNGILILISYEDRELRIEVGYGLEGIINDGKAGRIRDTYMIPYLKNNNWNEGIKNGYDAIYGEIVEANNLSLDYDKPIGNENTVETDAFFAISFLGVIIGITLGITCRIIIGKKKILKVLTSILYFIICFTLFGILLQYNLANLACLFMFNPFAFIVVMATNLDGSGSGYSGRSHGGYSGHSSGGGFSSGGFSGGGGSFGGGGASGKF